MKKYLHVDVSASNLIAFFHFSNRTWSTFQLKTYTAAVTNEASAQNRKAGYQNLESSLHYEGDQ
jgi:hypothetical protein